MFRLLLVLLTLTSLNGCGSSSSSTTSQTPLPDDSSAPTPSPTPPTNETEACSALPLTGLSASATEEKAPFNASKAIDGDTSNTSRWQSTGTNSALVLSFDSDQQLGALQIKWYDSEARAYRFSIETSLDGESWDTQRSNINSNTQLAGFELYSLPALVTSRYIRVTPFGNSVNDDNAIVELQVFNCTEGDGEISSALTSTTGIDLQDWYLSIPTDNDDSGTADNIGETRLQQGYTNSEYFYVGNDGALVMRSPTIGFKTSVNTNYVRVELREMLRRGDTSIKTQGVNKNNWVLSSASQANQDAAGGVNGRLRVEMAVNEVTTTGESFQVGRVIIGQIHANDDEPIRLYYRKLPSNNLGAIYFAHERRAVATANGEKEEIWVEMIGSRDSDATNPTDGIALNERFTYVIDVEGDTLTATISREGKSDVTRSLNIGNSGYDEDDQYLYFKVGVYHVNNSANEAESAVASFYSIENEHGSQQPPI